MSEVTPRGSLTVTSAEVCNRGLVREENQDNVRKASLPIGELFIVADGIGGYQGGATASKMVVDGFHSQLAIKTAGYDPDAALQEACTYTNNSIFTAASSGNPATQRMGSTVVLALIHTGGTSAPMATVGHVGDSRAYLIRSGRMQKVTSDHSAVQALLSRNLITEEEARNHPDASVLTRSLGHRPEVEIEIDHVPLQAGDALLLCSDGLWGYVSEADISAVVTDPTLSESTVADALLRLALEAGGQDNIGIEYIRLQAAAPAIKASAPAQFASAPRSSATATASAEPMTRQRKQQLAAIALLLLGGLGGLGLRAYTKDWFNLRNPNGGQVSDVHGLKKMAVIGDEVKDWPRNTIAKAVQWTYAPFAHDSKPGCTPDLKDRVRVYMDKATVDKAAALAEIEKQYPDLKLRIDGQQVEYPNMTPEVQQACGVEFDVVVILPRAKATTPEPQPLHPPTTGSIPARPANQPQPANQPAQPAQSTPGATNAAQRTPDDGQTADQHPSTKPAQPKPAQPHEY